MSHFIAVGFDVSKLGRKPYYGFGSSSKILQNWSTHWANMYSAWSQKQCLSADIIAISASRQVPPGQLPPGQVPPGGNLSKGELVRGNLSGGKLSGGKLSFLDACLPGELVRGKVVRRGTCPGGSCPGGTCPQGHLSGGNLLAVYIQYKYTYKKMYIPDQTYSPTLRPKGAQKPSNLHTFPKCWQFISNTNIFILQNVHWVY